MPPVWLQVCSLGRQHIIHKLLERSSHLEFAVIVTEPSGWFGPLKSPGHAQLSRHPVSATTIHMIQLPLCPCRSLPHMQLVGQGKGTTMAKVITSRAPSCIMLGREPNDRQSMP